MESREKMRKYLESLGEPSYLRFASSLIPELPVERFLGIRLPLLRKIARRIAADRWEEWLSRAGQDSFEEVMLQGMVIGYGLDNMERRAGGARRLRGQEEHGREERGQEELLGEARRLICWFLPRIDNWSVCDSFCSTLKIAGRHRAQLWPFVTGCLRSGEEYTARFGAVMLLDYYVDREYLGEALAELEQVDQDSYYVKMAVAWALSMFYLEFPKETEAFLEACRLDDFTYNKTLQKICESRRADREMKERVRAMRRGKLIKND
ncbi:DNA alkylation repair protein [Faecalicatena fissicatena]|uniref:DNA alkylation repair protein n=1 Tax=Faecalicatena fissicatena TaxID=290055 RepID=A0ABS2E784_9FIRM|nr:DNA alkylation repair protein [Faecalicatena fissicatena]